MTKTNRKLGALMSVSVIILLILMCVKNDIEFLSKEDRIFTSSGIGDGVFFSIGDFLTYNAFVISGVLAILWIGLNIVEYFKK